MQQSEKSAQLQVLSLYPEQIPSRYLEQINFKGALDDSVVDQAGRWGRAHVCVCMCWTKLVGGGCMHVHVCCIPNCIPLAEKGS